MPLAAGGEFALVRQTLEAALETPAEWIGDHEIYATLVDLAARLGDRQALARYAPQAEDLAEQYGHRLYQAVAHRAWAVLHRLSGEVGPAALRLERALELFSALGTPWQIGRTRLELGLVAAAGGRAADAAAQLALALQAFEQLGAAPDVARVRAALAALG